MQENNFPTYLKAVWWFMRGFVSAGLTTALAQLTLVKIDTDKPQETLYLIGFAVLVGFITGFIQALMKYLREDKPYDSLVHKMPL